MKLNQFFKTFFLLFIIELIIGLLDVVVYSTEFSLFGFKLQGLTNYLVHLISLPVNLLGRDYPFYAGSFGLSVFLFIVNVFLHTILVHYLFKLLKKK